MRICVIGAGYVGLTISACLAHCGHKIFCVEKNLEKLALLQRGECPIYEPGLDDILVNGIRNQQLKFVSSLNQIEISIDCFFIAVGTPSLTDGSADLTYIYAAIQDLLNYVNQNFICIMKSTVPVGTAKKIKNIIDNALENKGMKYEYISNPEFLKEGIAVNDFFNPDRIVVGAESEFPFVFMKQLYKSIVDDETKYICVTTTDAELIKYAANSFLATKISFINEMSRIAEHFDANILNVAAGIGSDSRISRKFLQAGCGYGGSCFPKDIDELIMLGIKNNVHLPLLSAVKQVNQEQKYRPFTILQRIFVDDFQGKVIAVWGASFKPNTDDIREAPSLTFIKQAVSLECKVKISDPIALPNIKKWLVQENLTQAVSCYKNPYDALDAADALVLLTEWEEFRKPDWARMALLLRTKIIVDGRNQYIDEHLHQKGFRYYGIGVGSGYFL